MNGLSRRNRTIAWLVVLSAFVAAMLGATGATEHATDAAFAASSHPGEHDNGSNQATGEVLPPTNKSPAESVPYLNATREVVLGNSVTLCATTDLVLAAMSARDMGTLNALIHPSEGDQTAYVTALAGMYPPVLVSEPCSTINIFCTSTTTLYFSYRIVTWSDRGVTSTHTVPVILRFADGRWWLTSRAGDGATLRFVQAVKL